MKRIPTRQIVACAFDIVRTIGLELPGVEATTKYDGSPVLKLDGIFVAGLAMHPSAEPDTLVVRSDLDGPRSARGRCARHVLPDRLLSKLSAGAGASEAGRAGRFARLVICVMAHDDVEDAEASFAAIRPRFVRLELVSD